MTLQHASRRYLSAALLLALVGCGRKTPPPEPGVGDTAPPDLRGSVVMVLPFQDVTGPRGDVDAELAFALQGRGRGVTWILPPRLQEALDRSPGLGGRIRGLSVGAFGAAEVKRVGDPLYGDLRRVGSLVDAEVALLPLRVWVHTGGQGSRLRASAALLHVRTGRVLWFGLVEGEARDPAEPGALAAVVERLAQTLLWYAEEPGTATTGG